MKITYLLNAQKEGRIIKSKILEFLHCQSNFLDVCVCVCVCVCVRVHTQKEPKKNVGLFLGSLSGNEAVKPMKLSSNVELVTLW